MNTVLVYLVVTMGSKYGISYQGYGGVSVTPTPSYEVCEILKESVHSQLTSTPNIDIDDVRVTCKMIKGEDL